MKNSASGCRRCGVLFNLPAIENHFRQDRFQQPCLQFTLILKKIFDFNRNRFT